MSNPLDRFVPLLDAERMAAALQQHLPECRAGDWQVTGCEIQHPRYKTYRLVENRERSFLSLVYHLRGHHPAATNAEQRILYVRAYIGNRSRQAYTEAQANGERAVHLAELGMVGWRFPDDPAMPWLAELMGSRQIAELGQRPISAIEIVNYRPEIRCTARYRFVASETEPARVIYGKTYADQRGRTVYQHLDKLQQQPSSGADFVMPQALAYAANCRTLWLDGLHGEGLAVMDFSTDVEAKIPVLAAALAAFHRLTPPTLPTITLRQHLQEWGKKADKLLTAYPLLQPKLAALLAELGQNHPKFATPGLIHGDFHIGQLLVLADGRLALFDYDELALGDPLQDLANFAADLYNYAHPFAAIDRLVQQLFTAYAAASHNPTDPQRFAWHLRGQLLTRAYRCFIQQKPAAPQRVADFMALALRPWPLAD